MGMMSLVGQDLALGERSCSKRDFTIPYTKQGNGQPFGYTGYRYDEISGSYFAQAREYQPGTGRFMAEDVMRGRREIPKTLNRYGYCWGNPMILVDLDGRWPSWSDIGKGVSDALDWAKEAVSDAAEAVVDSTSRAIEGIVNFYNENKEVIDTIAKIGITIASGAAAVSTALAVAATAPVSIPVAAVVGTVLGTGVAGGILGGFSNEITGGSFLNGFCGGFVSGCFGGIGGLGWNFFGGFLGNMLTENFNNLDIADPGQRKDQLSILATSLGMGTTQAFLWKILPIDKLIKDTGLQKWSSGYLIANFFKHNINFSPSASSYIMIDGIIKKIKKIILERFSTCSASE